MNRKTVKKAKASGEMDITQRTHPWRPPVSMRRDPATIIYDVSTMVSRLEYAKQDIVAAKWDKVLAASFCHVLDSFSTVVAEIRKEVAHVE